MNQEFAESIHQICHRFGDDRRRLMDVANTVQRRFGWISGEAVESIADCLGIQRVEVQSVVSFYAFLSEVPGARVRIRLCDDIIDRLHGAREVERAFEEELGIGVGQTTPDGKIGLERTACIGMCDQAPAALCNDVVLTELSTDRARRIARSLRRHLDPQLLIDKLGDGHNASEHIQAMVNNNIRRRGPVLFAPMQPGAALKKALAMSPAEVIRSVKTARLRGRGGAGFPTGMKWEFTRAAAGERRVIICNADEGEPGTFKDRVLLTECADLLAEGMTIGAYALGADEGILYLRAEYAYLRAHLEQVLEERRRTGLLGAQIAANFNFDIRIQMGAGAYICGEETALINSCEGERGDPRNRPPFPAQSGYLGRPTSVNNVETLCCVARILERGAAFFAQLGSQGSTGTKLLSISGDCKVPGVYEVPFGLSLRQVLEMAGGSDAAAVQVGGPSGQMVGPEACERKICYDDLATGGSIMVFGPQRDLLEVVEAFMGFFVDESCGYCTPCRVGNVLLKKGVEKIIAGQGETADLDYLRQLGRILKLTSRCGLGQTSPNPILSTLENFRAIYDARLRTGTDGLQPDFDLSAALGPASAIAGRPSVHFPSEESPR